MSKESRTISLPMSEFLAIPPYQGQRKTEKHANRIFETLRDAPPDTLKYVAVVEYSNGKREVLDGNSRQFLWETSRLKRPTALTCTLWSLPDAEAARPYYESYNAASSAKSARDETVSAMGLCGWVPKSSICRDATLRTPLCLAEGNVRGLTYTSRNTTQYELMPLWLKELQLFDDVCATGVTRGRTHSSITAAFLMTVRAHGEEVLPFWRTWFSEAWRGNRTGDPMGTLYHLMKPPKVEGLSRIGKTGGAATYSLLRAIIYIVERWRRGDEYIEQLRTPQITGYCETGHLPSIRRKKRMDDDEEEFESLRL